VKSVSGTIPTVITNGEDPVASGLVLSLAHPGGNITGLTSVARDLSSKRLQLVKTMLPSAANVAVVWNGAFANKVMEVKETQSAAITLGLQIIPVEIQRPDDIDQAFADAINKHIDALISLPDPLTNVLATRIIELAKHCA